MEQNITIVVDKMEGKKMMKFKITRKQAMSYNPIKMSYCGTTPEEREAWVMGNHFAYNAGVYGWNFDLIEYNGKYYISGYRNY